MGCYHVRKFCYISEQPAVGCYKPLVSREALTGWEPSNSGTSSCSDLASNRFWILSQFLDEQLLSAENFSKSPDWILGDWWDFIPQKGGIRTCPLSFMSWGLQTGNRQVNVHVSPANKTCDTDKSVCSFNDEYAGQPWRWADLCAPPLQA